MKRNRELLTSLSALLLLVLAALACGGIGEKTDQASTNTQPATNTSDTKADNTSTTASGIRVDKIELAKDDGNGDAGDTVTSFRPSDNPIHFVARLSEFKAGTKVRMVLTAVDAGGSKNEKVGEVEKETTAFENVLDAHWEFPKDWPTGRYKIEAYVNGKLDKSLEFDIR